MSLDFLQSKSFENTMGKKKEIALSEKFLLFPTVFPTLFRELSIILI